jgi:hypothetical protein
VIDDINYSNACACLGPMYYEPYCYCEMKRRGLDMDNNPLRKAEEARSKEQAAKMFEPGGFFYELNRKTKDEE